MIRYKPVKTINSEIGLTKVIIYVIIRIHNFLESILNEKILYLP